MTIPLTIRHHSVWALAGVCLAACSNQLNTADIEATIEAEIERQGYRLSLAEVRCPNTVPRQTNHYFRCVGELDSEETFTINVVQQDGQGTVEWEVPNSKTMLNLVKVETRIAEGLGQALGQRAIIDCGHTYRTNQPGDRFECQVVGELTDGRDRIDAVLVMPEPDGNLTWQELRQPIPAAAGTSTASTAPAQENASSPQVAATESSVKTTTVSGPGNRRQVNRPYLPGDDD
ncbi:hypothetical protein XM38_047530 [Halomicronema hongdechloris C2206]|uniref:DUF4333 domain-containing protein n=1 Tax=Halomicronema hongdechloris C2206 TaxID=1641165 RepID=A0A1Z3HTX5_9CYAN|nr:DUF4333 domain-containing protein [Halomicronema hongdechloris]ASC73781.1 hypothetical protein XM38_047530 [Halomicronema hongdechloris C2206]